MSIVIPGIWIMLTLGTIGNVIQAEPHNAKEAAQVVTDMLTNPKIEPGGPYNK